MVSSQRLTAAEQSGAAVQMRNFHRVGRPNGSLHLLIADRIRQELVQLGEKNARCFQ
jgi:hypothetical protein